MPCSAMRGFAPLLYVGEGLVGTLMLDSKGVGEVEGSGGGADVVSSVGEKRSDSGEVDERSGGEEETVVSRMLLLVLFTCGGTDSEVLLTRFATGGESAVSVASRDRRPEDRCRPPLQAHLFPRCLQNASSSC